MDDSMSGFVMTNGATAFLRKGRKRRINCLFEPPRAAQVALDDCLSPVAIMPGVDSKYLCHLFEPEALLLCAKQSKIFVAMQSIIISEVC